MNSFGQKKKSYVPSTSANKEVKLILLKPENWDFKPDAAEFITYKSRAALKILTSSDMIVAKDINFTNGTIEYDMEPLDPQFTSFYFRWISSKESECFYFRTGRAGNSEASDAIQYAPFIDGVNLWDMLPQFQTNADFKKGEWNHIKLIISGKQMRVFVNNMQQPALEVPILEGNVSSGSLAFDGQVIISNLIIKNNEVEGLTSEPGTDLSLYDSRFLRKWKVNEPITMEEGVDFRESYLPKKDSKWEEISVERGGLVNLTRKFGNTVGKKIVWLQTTIISDKAQDKMMHFGFSDEVWLLINDKPLYIDKNLYNTPMAKQPDGRCSLENSYIKVPLKEGKNVIMIGVSNFFYGWGIIARLDNTDGIHL
jgi:hypothetical protein